MPKQKQFTPKMAVTRSSPTGIIGSQHPRLANPAIAAKLASLQYKPFPRTGSSVGRALD